MEQTELRQELIKTMNEISSKMRDHILLDYFDKLGDDKKYVLSMMIEAYQTVDVFCYAMQNTSLTQAGLLLRQLLEQVAISYILVEHPETLLKFIEHYKLRKEWINLKKGEQIEKISEKYGVPDKPIALAYLDYGWIGFDDIKKCNEDEMLIYAGFKDILPWRKMYLDKLAHTSFTSTDLLGEQNDFPITRNFLEIACKLFDYLCVAFHNLTKFSFIFDNNNLFASFRLLYSDFNI